MAPLAAYGQAPSPPGPQDIPAAQLQVILALPLGQAVQQRQLYKPPLQAALASQREPAGKTCGNAAGQQPYNLCMGQADQQADADYAVFYNNLQLLCHSQQQLTALQASERAWLAYKASAMHAAEVSWPDGTGAPGMHGQVYLALIRQRMLLLSSIYDLNITQ